MPTDAAAFGQTGTAQTARDKPIISLVMGTYQRAAELEPMLHSILAQTNTAFELIVVDQNTDDRIVDLLRPLEGARLRVRHLRQAEPNLSAARNLGLRLAQGELVAFPDDDCWYDPDVLERVIAYFRSVPEVDGIVARWVEFDPIGQRPAEELSLDRWRRFKGGDATSFTLFFRTNRVTALGGFDETFGTGQWFGCGEETDLVLRLLEDECRIVYIPDIHIHHRHFDVPEFSARRRRRDRYYGRGTGAVQAKHRLPLWVIGRGLIGPLYNGLRGPNAAAGFLLGLFIVWGRIEGLVGWWLWGRRQAQ